MFARRNGESDGAVVGTRRLGPGGGHVRRIADYGDPCQALQGEFFHVVPHGALVCGVANESPADTRSAGLLGDTVHGETGNHGPHGMICLDEDRPRPFGDHANLGAHVHRTGIDGILVRFQSGNAVGIHTPQVGPDQYVRLDRGIRRRHTEANEDLLGEALEVLCVYASICLLPVGHQRNSGRGMRFQTVGATSPP